jgi:hypothetical protein
MYPPISLPIAESGSDSFTGVANVVPEEDIVGAVKPLASTSVGIHIAHKAMSPLAKSGAVVPFVSAVVNGVPEVGAVVLDPSAVP